MTTPSPQFDFEAWRELAKTDPERFEQARREAVEALINSAPRDETRLRLSRLQWRIDRERERASNPLSACIRIYNMMWASLYKQYEALSELGNAPRATPPPPPRDATVLRFTHKTHDRSAV